MEKRSKALADYPVGTKVKRKVAKAGAKQGFQAQVQVRLHGAVVVVSPPQRKLERVYLTKDSEEGGGVRVEGGVDIVGARGGPSSCLRHQGRRI